MINAHLSLVTNIKRGLILCFILIMQLNIIAQVFQVQITLSDVSMINECHFGDEWQAYFTCG